MTSAQATPNAAKPPRRWWLGMLVASAALVAVLLGVVWLTPIVPLHYYAWRYRRRHNGGGDLPRLADRLLAMRASPERVTGLLGPSGREEKKPDGRLVLFYDVGGVFHDSLQGMYFVFDGDRLGEVKEVTGRDLLLLQAPQFPGPELDLELEDEKK